MKQPLEDKRSPFVIFIIMVVLISLFLTGISLYLYYQTGASDYDTSILRP